MFFRLLFIVLLFSFKIQALENNAEIAELRPNKFENFTNILIGKDEKDPLYNKVVEDYSNNFKSNFIDPISMFSAKNINTSKKSLFYPFAGPDVSYPLLLFPNLEQYVLVGLEFPGNPDMVQNNFKLSNFKPQIEGYLKSGFFKTMNMSAQMHYYQGVIPMIVAQIGLLSGRVQNIEAISEPYKGIIVTFTHNQIEKKLYYFRANLNDNNNKDAFFNFLHTNNVTENCMLKASSYKLHQVEFKQLRQFMLDNCQLILQDDTGMPVKLLENKGNEIEIFGNYVNPYGSEFKPYYQKELAYLYKIQQNKTKLDFCFGYGCDKIEANILISRKIN